MIKVAKISGILIVSFFICFFIIKLSDKVSYFSEFELKRSACEKKGGYFRHKLGASTFHVKNYHCYMEYSDARKKCLSNSDCIGECIKTPNNIKKGMCSPYEIIQGQLIVSEKCPYQKVDVNESCDVELFNKSDSWMTK